MKTKILLLVLICIFGSVFATNQEPKAPTKVVIIGGGPSGLAAAIEAHETGAIVTVAEKRSEYSRLQWIFLQDSSIKLLEKWKASPPQMAVIEIEINGQKEKFGFVQIKILEEQLEKTVNSLGIKIIQGEFTGLKPNTKSVVISTKNNNLSIPYDILVGADGTHSNVRKALGIEMDHRGKAVAFSALIPCSNEGKVDISDPIYKNGSFVRRILTPGASIIFSQSPRAITQEQFQEITEECGWTQEGALLAEGKGFFINDIEVNLQQSITFSDPKKSAILIGDAAATASFFQGMGANTALKTAELAGNFFKDLQNKDAYKNFNQAMQEITNEMIEDSQFLFPEPKQ